MEKPSCNNTQSYTFTSNFGDNIRITKNNKSYIENVEWW